jgi:hypothetical protein
VLALELGTCTAAIQHLFARMDTMGMRRMAARLTVTTARVGSLVDYSLGPDPGSTAMADIGAMAVTTGTAVIIMATVVTTAAAAMLVADRSLLRMEVSQATEPQLETQSAVDSEADQPVGLMALAGSTEVAAVMAAVEAMAVEGTGN